MNRARSLISMVGGLLMCAATMHAQTRDALIDLSLDVEPGSWLVGLASGYSSNFRTGGFRAVPGREDVPVLEDGRGGGFQIGVVAEYLLSRYFVLDGRVVYDMRAGHFERSWPDTLILLGSGERRPGDTTGRADVAYRLVTTDLLLSGRLGRISEDLAFTLSAGPSFGLIVGTEVDQWVERTDGTGARSYSSTDRSIAAHNELRLAFKAGGGLEWQAADRLWVNARAVYEIGITEVTDSENWQLDALLFQLDLLVAL
jgi:hypothetical protein